MGRIRSIKPEWIDDERFNACSDAAIRMSKVFYALVDDDGRYRASLRALGLAGWKFCDAVVDKTAHATGAVNELIACGWLIAYQADGYDHWQIRNFAKHQKISHHTPSKLPAPPESSGILRSAPEASRVLRPDLDLEGDQGLDLEGERIRARAREATLTPPAVNQRLLTEAISEARKAAGGAAWSSGHYTAQNGLRQVAEWAQTQTEPVPSVRRQAEAFFRAKGCGARMDWFYENPGADWSKTVAKPKGRTSPEPTSHATFAARAIAAGVGPDGIVEETL